MRLIAISSRLLAFLRRSRFRRQGQTRLERPTQSNTVVPLKHQSGAFYRDGSGDIIHQKGGILNELGEEWFHRKAVE
jgi:hypothetical protein